MANAGHRMTRKGQVTIPAAIRHKLGLRPGDAVRFVNVGERVEVEPVRSEADEIAEFERWLRSVAGSVDFGGRDTDEIMDEIRPQRLDAI